ncbi:MAG: UDP-N-acetylmuramate dehydrogenase [Proteobacteria bacterium]|nr:UDP-N-acetylmuramate dehydrogenase [Pseudomonadota bacterium]MDA0967380.1 UDP-N-acetylmuramate dehydrogenase [Pseudomonadota bacterium]
MHKMSDSLVARLPQVRGNYRRNVNLSKINWFNVGGNAEVVFRPEDSADLALFLKNKPEDVKVTVLGVGSNLLVRDGGIDGVVIRLGRGFTQLECDGEKLIAGAAGLSFNAAMFAASGNIAGLEFLSGIPGTIGGALFMNAGAYGSDVSSVLESAEIIDEAGNINTVTCSDIGYIYRGNTLPHGIIFTKGVFKGKRGNKEDIEKRIYEITQTRESTQPVKSRTGGSTFKNPEGKKAWQLIDEAGCRGLKVGNAQVSEKHCNFFINTGNATAEDIETLGEEVRKRVKENSGIDLQWEIKIIGNKK